MNRLTTRNSNGTVRIGEPLRPYNYQDIHGVLERLAAYEDTGLEPQEIEKIRRDIADGFLKQTARRYGVDVDRIRELVEADRDGRCAVLPCKFGGPVYRIYDDCTLPWDCYTKQKCRGCEYRNIFIEEQAFCLSMLSQNGELEYPYYTSKEAAEAALKGEQNEISES